MKDSFVKFPSTPHLAALPGADLRSDKVLTETERDAFLKYELLVEEKVDGANLGISFDSEGNIQIQNRGEYLNLPGSGQWKKLGDWLVNRIDTLFEYLTDRYILFGEWCYAQHLIYYERLPDWFLGYDIYDKLSGRFLSSYRRNHICEKIRITRVPVIARGRYLLPDLVKLLTRSQLTDHPAEGLYLRYDQDKWLEQRAKLVRPEFIRSIGKHWSRTPIRPNRLHLEKGNAIIPCFC